MATALYGKGDEWDVLRCFINIPFRSAYSGVDVAGCATT